MRYYLDTNILEFMRNPKKADLHSDIIAILSDYSNILMTSTVCLHEFVHLAQTGKLNHGKQETTSGDILEWVGAAGIDVVPVSMKHMRQYAALPIHGDHKDPNDRLIVAQAISDKIPLISSDRKFFLYEKDGLDFIFNER